jgi:DNA polymerase III alpha subunit (gram-positive type)
MLPVIGGLLLIGAGAWIYNELQEQSSTERERWRSKKDEVQRSIEWHEEQINNHLDEARHSYDFKILIDMHFSCVKVADQAYALLKDARTSLDKIGEAIVKTKEQRELLFTQKKEAKSKTERTEIQNEITSIQELRKKLFEDKDEIKIQRDEFQTRVKELNSKTHTLKVNIKDRTGSRGVEWYQRLEERKARRSA